MCAGHTLNRGLMAAATSTSCVMKQLLGALSPRYPCHYPKGVVFLCAFSQTDLESRFFDTEVTEATQRPRSRTISLGSCTLCLVHVPSVAAAPRGAIRGQKGLRLCLSRRITSALRSSQKPGA